MKSSTRIFMAATVACGLSLMACGPREDAQTHVDVSTSNSSPDTVVQQKTVVEPGRTDTVVQQTTIVQPGHTDTVVKRQVDTVVKKVPTPPTSSVTAQEKARIDSWLAAHADSLNRYGDPKTTAYAGGTPLFDESTGRTTDRYDYIVMKHPDHPWLATSVPRR